MSFELEPPDDQTQAMLDSISRTAVLRPADSRYVRFYSRTKQDMKATAEAGRPIFKAVEYVEIFAPGDKDTIVDRPVRKVDPYLWPEKYRAFRNGQSQDANGMPLSEWGGVSPERVAELAHFRIKTVEQLADVPDSHLATLGMGARAEREKAKAYLLVMKGEAPVAELRAENDALKKRLDALEKLASGVGQLTNVIPPSASMGVETDRPEGVILPSQPKRRGRPAKAAVAE